MNSDPIRHTTEVRVRYAETDQMGVVYHANYLVWCEVGRTELLRNRGTSYARLEAEGMYLAVADASLRFHASARYDDLLSVETSVASVRSRAIVFDYLISRPGTRDPERLVTARTTLVALDDTGRPRSLAPSLLHLLRNDDADE